MSTRPTARPAGQIRQSQVVTTFGPGSMVDLPEYSVVVGGLETWEGPKEEIHEARLIEKLKRLLGIPQLRLFAPPPEAGDPTAPPTGVTGWQFPEWFVTKDVESGPRGGGTRSRMLIHRRSLTKRRFIDDRRKPHHVVPVRFVRACPQGHLADIDWYRLAHGGDLGCRRQLWLDERGTSGDLAELRVRCECGAGRDLSLAQKTPGLLGVCKGERPWLGPGPHEGCGQPSRLLIRSASNAYFPQVMSVISLPDKNESVVRAVDAVYSTYLTGLPSVDKLPMMRQFMPPLKAALDGFSDEEVWEVVLTRRGGLFDGPLKTVKQAEFEVLSASKDTIGDDRADSDFYARSLPRAEWDHAWMKDVERIVLVHKLREVVAQVGFTRFDAAGPDVEGELGMQVRRAPLARETAWLPAVENRGEGVFIQFSKSAIQQWLAKPEVIARQYRLFNGFQAWEAEHPGTGRAFPGAAYYLLHSLSHLLLTAVSLECGYPASSLRERVYSSDAGYGILLYTASPDAEGTLGGLVETGRQMARHLRAALEAAKLCSYDPVCAQHDPPAPHESRFMHGAACHGCLLVSETSCEQQNDFLDRALVVATVDDGEAEFFPE